MVCRVVAPPLSQQKQKQIQPETLSWSRYFPTAWSGDRLAAPAPQESVPNDGELVDLIAKIAPTEELRRKLMVENPQRLYERRGEPCRAIIRRRRAH